MRDRSEKRAPIGSPSRHSSTPRTLLLRAGFHDAARAGKLLGDPALLPFLLDDTQADDVGEAGDHEGRGSADRSRRPDGRPAEIRLGPEREELIDTLALTADPDMALLSLVRLAEAAATAESTPPDNPQIARPVSPTCSRTVSINSSAIFAGVQFCSNPAISVRKRTRISWPWGECSTSGWYCTPAIRRAAHSNAATGAPAEEAVTVKPSGAADTASP